MASKRSFDAPCSHGAVGGQQRDGQQAEGQGLAGCSAKKLPSVRPVRRTTSSARWMRWASVGLRRCACRGRGAPVRRAAPASLARRLRRRCRRAARVGLRQVGQAFAQRLDVQHGAADQQRDAAARRDVGHLAQRIGCGNCAAE
jgi:hypothetical protein